MSRTARICHLIGSNVDTAYFRSIARRHSADRFPVWVGSVAPAGALQLRMRSEGVGTFSLRARGRTAFPAAVVRLAHLLKAAQISIVHAHCFDPTLIGYFGARLAGVPFVFTRHHSDHHIRAGKRWHTRVDAWSARRADHVIAVSEATRRVMIETERVPCERITVVYNGMEPLPCPDEQVVDRLRRELGLIDVRVCLMVARLHEEKGHRYLFEAMPEVLRRCGATVCLLAGSGPHEPALRAEVRRLGLDEHFRFLGQRSDIAELTALADVAVLPSLAESFGFVVLEAMSAGKPVVAAATGGIPEVMEHGVTGLVVPQRDATALAGGITRILLDPQLARSFGEQGRKRTSLFTFDQMIDGYERVYARVAETKRTADRDNVPSNFRAHPG